MGRGLPIGRLWGMPVRVSPGLGLTVVALVVALVRTSSVLEVAALVAGVLLSVLAHEVAHGAAARRAGYEVDAVVLTLLGSHTVWSGAEDPDAQTALVISAAGPALSAALAGVTAVAGWQAIAFANLAIAVVNLVPLHGTDGWVIWKAATSSTTPGL